MPHPANRYAYTAVDENNEALSDQEVLQSSAPVSDDELMQLLRSLAAETLDKFPEGFDTFSIELVSKIGDADWTTKYIPFSQLLK
ncbi:hypothetical protein FPY71_07335 [Aureimonas fodinaquatilis]|uniref:Uncharacterized protein n=1 Tax=Aureimonas fodinaquatilis TaxID=2565783 RepID=A0A5B0DXP3_9HYPH|nr:hypothetical protein [Aureimonas fodinaquatilis]KAA0970330.1 hypothetical protein FPY71_07335 [Aureimonas fodinaquatilis]